MSEEPTRDDLPTKDRLDRIEQGVLARIRLEEDARMRRRRRLRGGGVGLALAAAVVGLVVVVHPVGQAGTNSGSAGGSGYSESSSGAGGDRAASGEGGATLVVCHAGDSTTTPAAKATVTDLTPRRIAAACATALGPEAARPSSTPTTAGIGAPVLCRDDRGVLQVFLTDRPAKAVCTANRMTPR